MLSRTRFTSALITHREIINPLIESGLLATAFSFLQNFLPILVNPGNETMLKEFETIIDLTESKDSSLDVL